MTSKPPHLLPVLTLLRNDLTDVSFPLEIPLEEFFDDNEKILIGRAPLCNIQIPSSLVRPLHAIIKRKRNNDPHLKKDTFSYYFIDLSSRFLINSSLRQVRLHSGDVIELVHSALRVKFELENGRLSAQVEDLKTELLDQTKQRLQALATHEKMVGDLEMDIQTLRTELDVIKDDKESQVVSVLESEYSCAICDEVFIDPSSLPCGHTFCSHCLRRCLSRKNNCPMCREPVQTTLLKKNVAIACMIDRTYDTLLTSEDVRKGRAKALKERLEEVKKTTNEERRGTAARAAAIIAPQNQVPSFSVPFLFFLLLLLGLSVVCLLINFFVSLKRS